VRGGSADDIDHSLSPRRGPPPRRRSSMPPSSCSVRQMAAARESAYAKLEQEAAIQRHRARLVGRGLLDDAGGEAWLLPKRGQTLAESEKTFEVLAEVLAAEARLDAPRAAADAHRGPVRRHGFAARRPAAEEDPGARAAAAAAGYGASALVLPRLPPRNRYWDSLARDGGAGAGPPAAPSHPAVADAARRVSATASRAGAYGVGAALAGAALSALAIAHWAADGTRATAAAASVEAAAVAALAPVAASARAALGGVSRGNGEFTGQLGRRLERRLGGRAPRAGGGGGGDAR